LNIILVTRRIEGFDREVGGKSPSEEVGEESSSDVEEDASDED